MLKSKGGASVEFHHIPVLLQECLDALAVRPDGTYVDCTTGGAGHSYEIARRLGPEGRLIGLDQDPGALAAAAERLAPFADRVRLVRSNFRHLEAVLAELGTGPVHGILMDLGVSSPQLDVPERGFTYREDAPLDMRMDPDGPVTAAELVNGLPEPELARILWEYGEERYSRRIARRIVSARQEAPIRTTGELVELIRQALPAAAKREPQHPARRTFQALRIAVNDELGALEQGLDAAVRSLAAGGRLAVISFHSLEDRIVKQQLARRARGCTCPPRLPACVCGGRPEVRLVGRQPRVPTPAEQEQNPRARSAKLRVAEKL